jgi:hypothetical protein
MRCICCNARLSNYEATRRHKITREFLDLCSPCYGVIAETSSIPYVDRPELLEIDDEEESVLDGLNSI